jgi:hypothetical protein
MHYLNHVPRALQMFGPTRLISARPLERMIGKLKTNIRSKRSPAANSYNSVLNHFADSYKKIQKTNENFRNTTNIEYKSSQYKALKNDELQNVIGHQNIRVIRSCSPILSGQTLRISRTKAMTSVVFKTDTAVDTHQDELIKGCQIRKYGILKMMFDTGADKCGLVSVVSPIDVNEYGVHYYNPSNCTYRWKIIKLSDIIAYGIEILSIDDRYPQMVNLLWKE